MGEIIRNGESYSGSGGSGGVTGVKGDKETAYRTGEVNLTPQNIGAVSKDNVAAGVPIVEEYIFEPYITDFIHIAEILADVDESRILGFNAPIVFEVAVSGFQESHTLYIQFDRESSSSVLKTNFRYSGPKTNIFHIRERSDTSNKWDLYVDLRGVPLYGHGSVSISRFSNPNKEHSNGSIVIDKIYCSPIGYDMLPAGTDYDFERIEDNYVKKDEENFVNGNITFHPPDYEAGGYNTPVLEWEDSKRDIWAGIKNNNGYFYLWDSTNNRSIIISDATGNNRFNGCSIGVIDNGDNKNTVTMSYSSNALSYSAYQHLAAWNGRQLRAVDKTQYVTTQSSSRRYKENIKPITEERARKILDVEIETFDYKNGVVDDREQYDRTGAIAEDVAEIYPEAVIFRDIEDLGNVPDAIDYSRFIPSMIKMMQMQQEEINALKKRVMDLEGES